MEKKALEKLSITAAVPTRTETGDSIKQMPGYKVTQVP